MLDRNNVLRINEAEEQAAYLEAVAEILRRVQNEHKVTHLEISERIGISLGTVSNAANKKGALSVLYLNRIGRAFGAHHLDPYAEMMGARFVPIDADQPNDILPGITIIAAKIAEARAPWSPGGARETHGEKLDYLPNLRKLRADLDATIQHIEALA